MTNTKISDAKRGISGKRKVIVEGLSRLPEDHHMTFKRMYSPLNLDVDVYRVVYKIPIKKLSWAAIQVQNSVDKIYKPLDVYEKTVQKKFIKGRGELIKSGSHWKNYDDVIDDILCIGIDDA